MSTELSIAQKRGDCRAQQPSVNRFSRDVNAVLETVEQLFEARMLDRESGTIRVQVPLRNVGRVRTAVRQHMIPRLVARRSGTGDGLVPLVAVLKCRIDVEDHASIAEAVVPDHLTYRKLRAGVVAGHVGQINFASSKAPNSSGVLRMPT